MLSSSMSHVVRHNAFLQVVKENWEQPMAGSPLIKFANELGRLKKKLVVSNKEKFGNLFTNVLNAENRFKELEIQQETTENAQVQDDLKTARYRLANMLENEEIFLETDPK